MVDSYLNETGSMGEGIAQIRATIAHIVATETPTHLQNNNHVH